MSVLDTIEKSFIALYLSDSRAVFYYYPDLKNDWYSFEREANIFSKAFLLSKNGHSRHPLKIDEIMSIEKSDQEDSLTDDFLLKARTIGFRVLFGSSFYLCATKSAMNSFKDFYKEFDYISNKIDLSSYEVLSICLKSYRMFCDNYNYDSKVIGLRKRLISMKNQNSLIIESCNRDKQIFMETCKAAIETGDEDIVLSLYNNVKQLLPKIAVSRDVVSSTESLWAYVNIEEYFKNRVSSLSSLPYGERASVMSAVVMSGNANKKIMRKIRSEQSYSASLYCVKIFFEYKYMYSNKDWDNLALNLFDSRHMDVVDFLCRSTPKNLLFYLLSNNYSNKDLLFKRMHEK